MAAREVTGPEFHAAVTRVLDQEKFFRGNPPFMLPFVATANAAYRVAVLRAVGGFDETLSICEDADLAWRVQWEGYRIGYVAEAKVRHHHRPDRRSYFRQVYHYGQGTARLFAKHRRRLRRSVWIEWRHLGFVGGAVGRAVVAPILGKTRWERIAPLYDVVTGVLWTAGRVREAVRRGVLVV